MRYLPSKNEIHSPLQRGRFFSKPILAKHYDEKTTGDTRTMVYYIGGERKYTTPHTGMKHFPHISLADFWGSEMKWCSPTRHPHVESLSNKNMLAMDANAWKCWYQVGGKNEYLEYFAGISWEAKTSTMSLFASLG